jgi:uncharacterized protein YdbL (DUF1318 family)
VEKEKDKKKKASFSAIIGGYLMKLSRILTAGMLLGALVGCATVNIYVTFPEEKIRKAVESFEDQIDQGASLIKERFFALLATEAYAQELSRDLKMDSPKIREAARLRKSWAAELNGYRRAGFVGESNRFEIIVVSAPSDSAVAEKVRALAGKENTQRMAILEEISSINNMAPTQKNQLPAFFAEQRRNSAATGDWIQMPDGTWKRK